MPNKMSEGREGIEEMIAFIEVDGVGVALFRNEAGLKLTVSGSKEYIQAIPHHQELQKAREEERKRIEAIFKEHVPPHAMDLEDSVWLKRLLNKAFGHENIY